LLHDGRKPRSPGGPVPQGFPIATSRILRIDPGRVDDQILFAGSFCDSSGHGDAIEFLETLHLLEALAERSTVISDDLDGETGGGDVFLLDAAGIPWSRTGITGDPVAGFERIVSEDEGGVVGGKWFHGSGDTTGHSYSRAGFHSLPRFD